MKALSPQKQKLLELFKDAEWHCSNEITPLFIRDYRKRLSEMSREGFEFKSMRCDGRCRVNHSSNVHMYCLVGEPQKPVDYVKHPVTGERITTEELGRL